MASSLAAVWDGGVEIVGSGPVDDHASDAGASRASKRSSTRASTGPGRAKRGKGNVLSSSFTCWKSTPEIRLNSWVCCHMFFSPRPHCYDLYYNYINLMLFIL